MTPIPADGTSIIVIGFLGSLVAGAATALGALPVIFVQRLAAKTQGIMLGFGAGVMLAAAFFSLILPGLEVAQGQGASDTGAATLVIAGILLGAIALSLIHRYAPHEHFIIGREGPVTARLRRVWLFIIAITLHNFPEGLAVGVGFGGGNIANGVSLAAGIGLQNMPEGLVVAVALLSERYSRAQAFLIAAATGMVEPIGGLLGVSAVTLGGQLLPWGLAFAAGAMIFVISNEIIPETHRGGISTHATFGLMAGFVIMMFLDVTLG